MTDVADEAAGEVIYSYDGNEEQDPVVLSSPPLPASAIEGGGMPTAPEAFEAFAGKVYKPASWNTAFAGTASSNMTETTLERVARLQKEMELLEQDLQTVHSDADSELPHALLGTVQYMKTRLEKAAQSVPPQQTLTGNIDRASTNIQTPTSKASGYSLVVTKDKAYESILEARLQRLEEWIGGGSATSSADASLSERLQSLESTLSKLNEKELESKAKNAKVIRQDLEAASRARNKLLAGGSGSSTGSDSKTLTELCDTYLQLQGMAPHLPFVTQRLHALSCQHAHAAQQVAKLDALTQVSQSLTTQVVSLEHAVQTTEQNLIQTAAQMKDNIAALDQKLSEKGAKQLMKK